LPDEVGLHGSFLFGRDLGLRHSGAQTHEKEQSGFSH
jgi:hypothetical protein